MTFLVRGAVCAALIATTSACGRFGFDPVGGTGQPDASSAWWNPTWGHRIPITLRNTSDETLANVPVRISLRPARLPAGISNNDGRDLRFIDGDQATELPYEIETFNGIAREGEIWVLVPSLAARADHTIFLYLDNPTAAAGQRASEVWPPNEYRLVLHMRDVRDSSANANHPTNAGTTEGPGLIGPGRVFDWTRPAYLMVPDAPTLHPLSSALTVSSWVTHTGRVTDLNRRVSIARPDMAATNGDNFFLGSGEATGLVYVEVSTELTDQVPLEAGAVTNNAWFQTTLVVEGLTATSYLDGAQVMQVALDSPIQDSARPVTLGGDINASAADILNDDWFDGTIDEVRIEAAARSAAWVRIQYLSMTDQLATFGAIEARPL